MNTAHIKNKHRHLSKHRFVCLLFAITVFGGLAACKKYLDVKPDKAMVLPSTLEDCQALLDNYQIMNLSYAHGETQADNYFLNAASYKAQGTLEKEGYIWKATADVASSAWATTYQRILYANQALKTLSEITPTAAQQSKWNQIKGAALFFRAFNFFEASGIFCKPYDAQTAGSDLGLPLRLSTDISEEVGRGTLKQTYDQIIGDLNQAAGLLPAEAPTSVIAKARPGLAAVHGLLARVYLSMREYTQAQQHADACLKVYSTLTNYNTLDSNATVTFLPNHQEVIFNANGATASLLNSFYANIDPALYASYHSSDLRRAMFFKAKTGANAGFYQFKGSYAGNGFIVFSGLATDEQYLIRAEAYARNGQTGAAMTDLNTLMAARWKGTYVNRTAANADDALVQILTERRKELLYRSTRWTDLRRLNKEPRFAVTLSRNIEGTVYTLPPNDLRYTLLIPSEVLRREDLPQNPR